MVTTALAQLLVILLVEFPLTQKEYQICYQGTDIFKCAKDTKYYETLTVDIKTYLDTVPMNILVVTQSTRKGLQNCLLL